MASISDLFTGTTNGSRPVPTTVTASRSSGVTTLSVAALTGWETTTPVHFATYRTDASGNKVESSQCDWKGIVSGTTITSLTLKAGTDAGNSIGDVVEAMPTAAWADDLATGLLVSLDQDGTLKAGAVDNAAVLASNVVTTAKIADASVTNAKLSTTAGELGGAWQSWALAWTNLTVGNGTVTAKYQQIGKTVRFRVRVLFGSTTAISGSVDFTLPASTHADYQNATSTHFVIGTGELVDSGTNTFGARVRTVSTDATKATIVASNATGTYEQFTVLSSTGTHVWAVNDEILVQGEYEAA
jgi:hypothetical protein